MQRSAISVISLSTDTGRPTCTSSPRASSARRKSRRLSSAMMQGADPARQDLIAYVREPGGLEPAREGVRVRKVEHRLWQVGIGVPMFRHRAADRSEEHTSELQSPCNLVCRLLLEKKKKSQRINTSESTSSEHT